MPPKAGFSAFLCHGKLKLVMEKSLNFLDQLWVENRNWSMYPVLGKSSRTFSTVTVRLTSAFKRYYQGFPSSPLWPWVWRRLLIGQRSNTKISSPIHMYYCGTQILSSCMVTKCSVSRRSVSSARRRSWYLVAIVCFSCGRIAPFLSARSWWAVDTCAWGVSSPCLCWLMCTLHRLGTDTRHQDRAVWKSTRMTS